MVNINKAITIKSILYLSIPIIILFLALQTTFIFTEANLEQQDDITFIQSNLDFNKYFTLNNYTNQEFQHMQDVKILFKIIYTISYIAMISSIIAIIIAKKKKIAINKIIRNSGIISLFFGTIIIILAKINFFNTFIYFHKIFFPQGNWMFSAESKLIQTFPLEFFTTFAIKMFLIYLTISLTIILITIYYNYYKKK